MYAWTVGEPGPISGQPMRWQRRRRPTPAPGELLIKVLACGVCRTDLHVTEGDLAVRRRNVIPGHEIVGDVVEVASDVVGYLPGDRVGVAWLRHTCGDCSFCRDGRENLCPHSQYTGWDADGGYADYTCAPAEFCYRLPAGDPARQAPLLCAGIIGYRALKRAAVPAGGRLGLYGFGGSAHLCAQLAIAQGLTVHVMTRGARARRLASALGAASAGEPYAEPPELLDAAIVFAPVGDLVPYALRALAPGGTCAVAGIHLTDIPALNYERELFYEKQLRSVTSNTRAEGREFLALAERHRITPTIQRYALDRALPALRDLSEGRFEGAAVLVGDHRSGRS